jgi:hypothetical protein
MSEAVKSLIPAEYQPYAYFIGCALVALFLIICIPLFKRTSSSSGEHTNDTKETNSQASVEPHDNGIISQDDSPKTPKKKSGSTETPTTPKSAYNLRSRNPSVKK